MKIKIVSSNSSENWYRDKIGKIYTVNIYNDNNYIIYNDAEDLKKLIAKEDCEPLYICNRHDECSANVICRHAGLHSMDYCNYECGIMQGAKCQEYE